MKRKTVVIHQPDFIPYLGFFHRFLHADFFIALDHVQFVHGNNSWTHRDKIKTAQGEKWLTVSVKKTSMHTPINEVELSVDTQWKEKNLGLLKENYRKSPYYDEIMPAILNLYSRDFRLLREFNMASIEILMNFFDISIPWDWSSNLSPEGAKNEMLVDILQKVSATHYLSGTGARDYFSPIPFERAGIEVIWQNFIHPEYKQLFGEFIPFLSSIDLLFNHGIVESRKILRK